VAFEARWGRGDLEKAKKLRVCWGWGAREVWMVQPTCCYQLA